MIEVSPGRPTARDRGDENDESPRADARFTDSTGFCFAWRDRQCHWWYREPDGSWRDLDGVLCPSHPEAP